MKKCLLIQPGAFGDLFISAPIAKHYADLGYEVIWPTRKKFSHVMQHFSYATNTILDDRVLDSDWLRSDVIKCLELAHSLKPDLILNLADRGPHSTAELSWEKFEQTKYRLADLDFELKHDLDWLRDIEKENEIYDHFVGDEKDYVLAHLTSSNNDKAELPKKINKKVIELQEFKDDNIVGWYKVIKNARAIYCVESSVHCFIDGFVKSLDCGKYLLSRSTLQKGQTYTVSNYWKKDYLK
tara:strand:+ start:2230 stop:2949 length:720 start_codon:yes stop_codon:yes gene_type:complete